MKRVHYEVWGTFVAGVRHKKLEDAIEHALLYVSPTLVKRVTTEDVFFKSKDKSKKRKK